MRKLPVVFATSFLSILGVLVILGPAIFPGSALQQNVDSILLPASAVHWFGTDSLGRDLFARVLQG
jgi:oligopeptide transport system permease protein